MFIYPFLKKIINIVIILLVVGVASFLFAQEPNLDLTANRGYIESRSIPERKKITPFNFYSQKEGDLKEENLSELQKEARFYRSQGLEFQRTGNMDAAMGLYQKAVELDPSYGIVYNDLGIIYEARGFIERAEESYLKAIKLNPNYLSAYSNLALLYEGKRDLDKAVSYWKTRVDLGSADDPWTEKAKQRLEDIRLVLSNKAGGSTKEDAVIDLMKDITNEKSIVRQDDKTGAVKYFEKAKQSYNQEDYATAIKEALDAQQLDPANKEIENFIEKVQKRALLR